MGTWGEGGAPGEREGHLGRGRGTWREGWAPGEREGHLERGRGIVRVSSYCLLIRII